MNVTRWEIQSSFGDDACMVPARDGDYVSLKDYMALVVLAKQAARDAFMAGAGDNCGCSGFDEERWESCVVKMALDGDLR